MPPAIEVHKLSKTFGGRLVLGAVSFSAAAGEAVALVGANGSGKTTLLGCMASVIRPTAGEVRWFGRSPGGDPHARRLVGMTAHESRLYPHLTLRENLVFAARMHDVSQPLRRADEILEELGLRLHAGRVPTELSRGMRQRAALGRALVHDPVLLFLDEPFAGLDADGAAWLTGLFDRLRQRWRTLCFSEHDPQRIAALADRVLTLCGGRLEDSARDIPRIAHAA